MKFKLWQGILLLLLAALIACSKNPPKEEPPPPPTRIFIQLQAAEDINPDPTGRPSPVVFRLYELKNPDAFVSADFFKLYEQDSTVLAADLIARQEMLIRPGQTLQLERTPEAEIRYLGMLAAYRDLDNAVWRATLAIPPHQTTTAKIRLEKLAITALTGS